MTAGLNDSLAHGSSDALTWGYRKVGSKGIHEVLVQTLVAVFCI